MPDIKVKGWSGADFEHKDVPFVWLADPSQEIGELEEGETPNLIPFTYGRAVDKTVEPDFSGGDMAVEIPEGELVTGLTITKPSDLVPEKIADGEYIAGVGPGTHKGSGSDSPDTGVSDLDKPIRFYDPYGEVIYAYTITEIQELEELPKGPVLSGLTFEGWTHTLDELKSVTYFADVGPMYKYGSSPATVLIVETIRVNTSVTVCLDMWSSSYKVTIYWGDGASSGVTGTSSASSGNYRKTASHKYSNIGEYKIAIVCTSGRYNLGSAGNTNIYNVMDNYALNNYSTDSKLVYCNTANIYLKSVLCNSISTYPSIEGVLHSHRLKFVSMPPPETSGFAVKRYVLSTKAFANCPGLKAIAGKGHHRVTAYAFFSCASLRRVKADLSQYSSALIGCDGLEEVEYYSNAAIITPKMNVQWAMLMTSETPPTISATNPVWGTKPIYVPDSAVETYKAADGWSTVADYIVPASSYHQ